MGENFRKFHGFVAIHESFLLKVWGHGAFCTAKASNLRKFSRQSLGAWCLLHGKSKQSAKVSPQNRIFYQFPRKFPVNSLPTIAYYA